MQLHETELGRRFFGTQLPKMIKALERIADALEKEQKPVEEYVAPVLEVDLDRTKFPLTLRQQMYRIPLAQEIVIVSKDEVLFTGYPAIIRNDYEEHKDILARTVDFIAASDGIIHIFLED